MKTYRITIEAEAGIKHVEITTSNTRCCVGRAIADFAKQFGGKSLEEFTLTAERVKVRGVKTNPEPAAE